MKTSIQRLLAVSVTALVVFAACNKENSAGSNPNIPAGKSQVSVFIGDGPTDFYKVLIDIRQVAVLIDTAAHQSDSDRDDQWRDGYWGCRGDREHSSLIWDTLSIKAGVYDLLQLRNGTDSLLGSGIYPNGKVLKVRITLGSDNTLWTDSATSYPLEVFGFHPWFDINVRRENVAQISNNEFKLWLDFNLQKSIFFWSGTYYLKPFIVAFNNQNCTKLEGAVLPEGASPLIEAISSSDTLYAIPGEDGHFLIRSIPAGTYSVEFFGHHGYKDSTVNNIVITAGQTTKVPAVTLHQ